MWVRELRDADASCGGKAVGLARLIAAGLPVPDGFAIDGAAFRAIAGELAADVANVGHSLEVATQRIASAELPTALVGDVEARAAELGPFLVVRSSATIEDGAAGAAAGVFSSSGAVPLAQLWDAIRRVWTSALTPTAIAYARRRDAAISIGVIVQRYVPGDAVVMYTRPPGEPTRDEVLVQRASELTRVARTDPAARIAIAAEHAIGAITGADVELVGDFVVQARPIVHTRPHALTPPPPSLLEPLRDGRVWTWDVAHNPDPLSPAQEALVELVADLGPYEPRVVSGFLYYTRRTPPASFDLTALAEQAVALEARLEHQLDEAHPPASVREALARYREFYAIWAGELSPLISAARAAAPARGTRPSSIERMLVSAGRGDHTDHEAIAMLGPLSPAWDVAVPTFGERPDVIRAAITRAANVPAPTGEPDLAADLAERDDLLFARAQALVRRALLARGAELGLTGDDVFWIPFAIATGSTPLDSYDLVRLHREANAMRTARARAARWQMPLTVGGAPGPARVSLHGVGTGPRVTGRVVRFASLASAIAVGAGDVVVTRAVTPALAVLVVGCAALVSETGGLLDHGAALARELGIPCVVDCHDAWTALADGMIVTVDGDGGFVATT